jgi:hypothetical protein
MKTRKLIQFRHGNYKGVFHYTVYKGAFVALSEKNTGKIDYIRDHGALDLKFEDDTAYDVMAVDIIDDPAYVKEVYDYMISQKNSYFTDGYEGLCVLQFHK